MSLPNKFIYFTVNGRILRQDPRVTGTLRHAPPGTIILPLAAEATLLTLGARYSHQFNMCHVPDNTGSDSKHRETLSYWSTLFPLSRPQGGS